MVIVDFERKNKLKEKAAEDEVEQMGEKDDEEEAEEVQDNPDLDEGNSEEGNTSTEIAPDLKKTRITLCSISS